MNVTTSPVKLLYRSNHLFVAGVSVINGTNQTVFVYAYDTSNNYTYVTGGDARLAETRAAKNKKSQHRSDILPARADASPRYGAPAPARCPRQPAVVDKSLLRKRRVQPNL